MVVELMREISTQTDPQGMVAAFRSRARRLYGGVGSVSVSRRDLDPPFYRITRSWIWGEEINPWTQKERLPILDSGILGELLYADQPRVLADVRVPPDDPAYEHLKDARSLVCLPQYDGGLALNMVVRISTEPDGFDDVQLPEAVSEANLFGKATKGLVLANELHDAYTELDRELRRVAEIQRSLLPKTMPEIPEVDIAASYQTAARAGGDYYDFFDLGDGRWGLLIADASGHSTPAAVQMAILRTILHASCTSCTGPAGILRLANEQLCDQAKPFPEGFITAFYAVYDSSDGSLTYACAGHNPPLLVDREVNVSELDCAQALPLGIDSTCTYPEATTSLKSGDTLLLYTDGITEAMNPAGEMYGHERLLSCVHERVPNAQHIIDCVVHKLIAFTGMTTLQDDRTLVALRKR